MTRATPLALLPPTIDMNFFPVSLEDVPELRQRCWPDQSEKKVLQRIAYIVNAMQHQRGLGVMVKDEGAIVAYGQVGRWFQTAEISDLIVVPQRRGQGIGTALIQYLVQFTRSLNINHVEIGAAENNPRALKLYQLLGFRHERRILLDLGNGQEAVNYLCLDLPD